MYSLFIFMCLLNTVSLIYLNNNLGSLPVIYVQMGYRYVDVTCQGKEGMQECQRIISQ